MALYWAALAAAILISMVGQTLLKSGAAAPDFVAQLLNLSSLGGLCLYGGGALLYMLALRRIPMSVALPSTAVSYVVAALIGHYGFGEALSLVRVSGLTLICTGVLILTLG